MGKVEQQTAKAEALQEALAIARGTASSPNDMVTVEVGADGTLHSIQLSEQGSRLSATQAAEIIFEIHKIGLARAIAVLNDAVAQIDDGDDPHDEEADTEASAPVADVTPVSTAESEPVSDDANWPTIRPYRLLDEDEQDLSAEHQSAEFSYGSMEHLIRPYQLPEDDSAYVRILPNPPPRRRFPGVTTTEAERVSTSRQGGDSYQRADLGREADILDSPAMGAPEDPISPAAADPPTSQIREDEELFSVYDSPWDDWDYGSR
ncbi:YbaB/EbfC family nucleoid-associated protein [Nocardia goodfellowii]|uniref:DNA-binding protein YbaB n=1 Tax=Nocardia goodfellowii TaxID=882446 RepID=A0ABS4QD94_9NOCA|nr:YbaB/EbfC family nucleoid-associated protein [Nocardia goodfellowii]MBP2189655.1 DNA-binding protein YbaB [Nocardia goodfellowii]